MRHSAIVAPISRQRGGYPDVRKQAADEVVLVRDLGEPTATAEPVGGASVTHPAGRGARAGGEGRGKGATVALGFRAERFAQGREDIVLDIEDSGIGLADRRFPFVMA